MARSRKQRERKLRARLHEANVHASNIRKQLASQNDAIVSYVGGVTEFGHEILQLIARTNFLTSRDGGVFATHVLSTAKHMGFIEAYQQSYRWVLTNLYQPRSSDGETKAPDDGD